MPTAYQRHVGAEMKRGKTMKQAAKSWKSKKGGKRKTSSTARKTPKRRTKTVARRKRRNTKAARSARARRAAKSIIPKTVPSGIAMLKLLNNLNRGQGTGATTLLNKLQNGNYAGAVNHVIVRGSNAGIYTEPAAYAVGGYALRRTLGPGPKLAGPVRWW